MKLEFPKRLSEEEQEQLGKELQRVTGTKRTAVVNELASANMRLVARFIDDRYGAVLEGNLYEEMVSTGICALPEIIDRWDISRGRLSTWVYACLPHVFAEFARTNHLVPLSPKANTKLNRALANHKSNRRLSEEEQDAINSLVGYRMGHYSLDKEMGDSGLTMADLLPDDCSMRDIEEADLRLMLDKLDPDEAILLARSEGLFGLQQCTQSELAKDLRLSNRQVRRRLSNAHEKIKSTAVSCMVNNRAG